MGWLIAIFVIAMVVGPIMYLKPTGKEKRLSGLRLAARVAGLNVKLATIPRLDPEPADRVSAGGKFKQPGLSCATYQLNFSADVPVNLDVRFLRIPEKPTVPVVETFQEWMLDPGSTSSWQTHATPNIERALELVLRGAPSYCIAFSVNSRFLSCYWLERAPEDGPEVAEIREFLQAAESQIQASFM
jgi:hypothetical protein